MSLNKYRMESLIDKHDKIEEARLVQVAEEEKAAEEVKRSEEAKARKIKVK